MVVTLALPLATTGAANDVWIARQAPRPALPAKWQVCQPDQPISLAVTVRRRLFAFQALLLSAGMYDDQPSTDPATLYAKYAPQFVRDFGMSRNPGLAAALNMLNRKLHDVRHDSESKLGGNCGSCGRVASVCKLAYGLSGAAAARVEAVE